MKSKVLVLNQDYQAISVCSAERAFVLLYLKKAELIYDMPGKALRSVSRSFKFPSIIRLYDYVRMPYRHVSLSRANIFRRDNYRCGYCGTTQNLTIDHVMPRSRGGRDTWDNLITACQRCNTEKGNRTPEEAEMPLRYKPFRPSYIMYLSNFTGKIDDNWRPYLYMGKSA